MLQMRMQVDGLPATGGTACGPEDTPTVEAWTRVGVGAGKGTLIPGNRGKRRDVYTREKKIIIPITNSN